MSTTIGVHGLRVRGHHGVLASERSQGQDFVVDAQLLLAPAAATATVAADRLEDTVDYARLCTELAAVVAGEPVELLETLAGRLLAVCLQDPRVCEASVTVHKPTAPVPLELADVTVTATGARR